MRRFVVGTGVGGWLAAGLVVVGLGCQRDATKPVAEEPTEAYAKDISTVCNVEELAGVTGQPSDEAMVPIANYLGGHIKTDDGHKFLAKIYPMVGAPKAKALEDEARRVGLADCALAARWR